MIRRWLSDFAWSYRLDRKQPGRYSLRVSLATAFRYAKAQRYGRGGR